ncbi:BZ3500_MvSof-1268-A1-R1_Chr3-1g05430 [Microbotryum saponariae]|uniref:BZ3500_MvSof-1268-A1-R1_Chr3-1g05430 protein n=1 Tax=Microbotryum saponariae TaxID=289078 RepID=A0A2X0KW85_9BASI|nr:BZ3500_MvSof-1268-A1-R1_Chr3-1g05430 [Microbotryum saponariae]SDA04621.1 BZ3501_MvSof-1269-A2-R1_Chr3-1g05101 [Microbotryum saponariae]
MHSQPHQPHSLTSPNSPPPPPPPKPSPPPPPPPPLPLIEPRPSLKQPNRTYIGSTPDPKRRLKQHNGLVKGGAFKTKRARPWTMSLLVHGFPSKLQALQFEWAWQNPHLSRHLHEQNLPIPSSSSSSSEVKVVVDEDQGQVEEVPKLNPKKKKKDRTRSKNGSTEPLTTVPQFPKTTLSNRGLTKIQVLMFMLTSRPWKAFDLSVVCFEQLSKTWWQRAMGLGVVVRTEAAIKKFEKERRGVQSPWGEQRGRFLERVKVMDWFEGVHGQKDGGKTFRTDDGAMIDVHWAKWIERVGSASNNDCAICHRPVNVEDHLEFILCTSENPTTSTSKMVTSKPCTALYHLPCLAHHFTHTTFQRSGFVEKEEDQPPLLPRKGTCPSCLAELHWSELVRGCYRRSDEESGKREKMKRAEERRRKKEERERERMVLEGGRKGRKKVGRGKGKAVVEHSGSEDGVGAEERVEFVSGSESEEVGDEDEEDEVERSLAISVEADGELEGQSGESASEEEGEELLVGVKKGRGKGKGKEGPTKKVTKAKVTKEPSASTPKKRGRPKKVVEAYVELSS